MTVEAIVIATAADRRAGIAVHRLTDQLDRLGVGPVRVVPAQPSRLRAALAAAAGPVVVADAGVVLHDQAVRSLTEDPRLRNAALVDGERFLDVLMVDADALASIPLGDDTSATAAGLRGALAVAAVSVSDVQLRHLFWAHPEPAEAQRAITELEALDEDRLWLDSAVKADDGFFGTFFASPYSRFIARWAARRGIRPNAVTVVALVLALAAAALFALGHRSDRIAGAVVLYAAFVLDAVDGQLARYARAFTSFGAWLDVTTDRVKEYAVYAGLAIGASRVADRDLWVLAATAMCLQTVRHLLDHTFPSTGGSPGRRRVPWSHWPRKLALLPIGERFAVICLTAALWSPRVTFVVLLIWGGVAFCYVNAGRLRRVLA